MIDCYKTMFKEEGIISFWRGCGPNIIRNSLFNACELVSYDFGRDFVLSNHLMNDHIGCHFVVSAFAGCVTVLVGQPVD